MNRLQLMEFARDIDNLNQFRDLFAALKTAENKLHRDVWDAVTDDPASIRVETRGRSSGRRDHKGIPDGNIAHSIEEAFENRYVHEENYIDRETPGHPTKSRIRMRYYIRIDAFHEGLILIYVNDQLKVEKYGNRVLVSATGCY